MTETAPYITDDAAGKSWRLMLGDSCERLGELPDESIDLSVYSPPFQSLYVYSSTPLDLGNSATPEEVFAQMFGTEHYIEPGAEPGMRPGWPFGG